MNLFKICNWKRFLNDAKKEIIHILKDIPKCEVYLMPLGDTAEEINKIVKKL